MKKYKVSGYVPAGGSRWKLVTKVVELKDDQTDEDSVIGAWLIAQIPDERIPGTPYEIKSYEEVKE